MALACTLALLLGASAAASGGSNTACLPRGAGEDCQADGSSLSMLQRGSEARGRKRRASGEADREPQGDHPEWYGCDQPSTAPKTLTGETYGVLQQLEEVLEPFKVRSCFVTYIGEEADYYHRIAAQPWVKNICEIGFNAGHSAVLLLTSNPNAHLYSFDKGDKRYSLPAVTFMKTHFGDRFTITVGNSTVTVPSFAEQRPDVKCDLLIVDGGHQYTVARADIANFQALANPSQHLLLVDDTHCPNEVCEGPEKAWKEAVDAGVLRVLDRQGALIHGWSLGNYTSVGKSWLE